MTSGAVVRDSTTQRLEVFIKGSYEKIKDESMEIDRWALHFLDR